MNGILKKSPKNCLVLKFISLKEKKSHLYFYGKILTEINRLKEILTA